MARYECRIVPVGDASLRFEWYMNGVELKMGKITFFNDKLLYSIAVFDINKIIVH